MAGQAKSGLMTKIRRLALALIFVCAPVLAETKATHPPVGVRGVSSGKAIAPVQLKTAEIESQSGSRPSPGRPAQLLDHAADILSGDISRPIPLALAATIGVVLLLSFFLFTRERHLRVQRERLRKTYQLGEEVLGSSSSEAILKRLCESLPGILGISTAHLYIYNRASKALE